MLPDRLSQPGGNRRRLRRWWPIALLALASLTAAGAECKPAEDSGGSDVHVRLAPGVSGEIFPRGAANRRTRVTILQVVDAADGTNALIHPAPGKKWFALEVLVENAGAQEIAASVWKMRDSKDFEHDRAFITDVGQNLDANLSLTPGGKSQGWVVFELDADAAVRWVRADPGVLAKNDLYVDAE